MAHAGEYLRAIMLYLLPGTAPVSTLPPFQIMGYEIFVQAQSSRHALDNRRQGLP